MARFKVGDIIKSTSGSLWTRLEFLPGDEVRILGLREDLDNYKVGQIVGDHSPDSFEGVLYTHWFLDEESMVDRILEKYSTVSIDLLKQLHEHITSNSPESIKSKDLGEFRM